MEIVRLLLEHAPDALDVQDEDGETPLHTAARGDHKEVVRYLLQLGADPTITNSTHNHTPADEAEDPEVRDILEAAICDAETKA